MAERKDSSGGGCLGLFLVLMAVGAAMIAVAWTVSLVGHALDLTPTYPEWQRQGKTWVYAHYANVTPGYVLTALTMLGGVPLSAALTLELARDTIRAGRVVTYVAPLIVLALVVVFAPAGPR